MDEIERIERRLKLHDVRVLMSVVQAGSMNKAAERLGTSQPAVSRSIADLEHALGVRLLDRSRRGIEPTQYGRAIIKRGIAVFDELRLGVQDIEFLADPTAGVLRIGCTEGMAAGPVPDIMDRLAKRQSAHRVQRRDRRGDGALPQLGGAKNRACHVWTIHRVRMSSSWSLYLRISGWWRLGCSSPWTRRRRIELAELVNEPWTLQPPDTDPGALVMEVFRASGLEPPQTSVITVSLNLRNAILATGHYLTVSAGYALARPNKYPLLKALPVELPDVRRTMVIFTLRNRTLSPLAELFIKTARVIAKPLTRAR